MIFKTFFLDYQTADFNEDQGYGQEKEHNHGYGQENEHVHGYGEEKEHGNWGHGYGQESSYGYGHEYDYTNDQEQGNVLSPVQESLSIDYHGFGDAYDGENYGFERDFTDESSPSAYSFR